MFEEYLASKVLTKRFVVSICHRLCKYWRRKRKANPRDPSFWATFLLMLQGHGIASKQQTHQELSHGISAKTVVLSQNTLKCCKEQIHVESLSFYKWNLGYAGNGARYGNNIDGA